ncbi:MAG: NADH-quinone oxidoreductase subunit NuoK [Phycisphaerales bacterium]|nr:NADH-quinone oxidoreductase subunit NuoK [Phycisphaerales bacterium]|tara:strand:+ start:1720 stop:2040 length:321 start_codon:yes stop_codon:yes gene_type:complete
MMTSFAPSALAGYLIVSGLLLTIGIIGFLVRRNLIVMFLCTELMFQGAAIAFVAVGRYLLDYSGQVMVIFILTVAAAEAALALALVVLLHRQKDTLDSDAYGELQE